MAEAWAGLHKPLTWVLPYMADWAVCGKELTPARAAATVLRWFHEPGLRARVFAQMEGYAKEDGWGLGAQLRRNWVELFESDVHVGVSLPAAPLAVFLWRLGDGDIIEGGPTAASVAREMVEVRPGFAYLFGKWFSVLPTTPCPWPWWLFPTVLEMARGR